MWYFLSISWMACSMGLISCILWYTLSLWEFTWGAIYTTASTDSVGRLNIKMLSHQYIGISMFKIKRSYDRLIFDMEIPIPGKDGLYIETGPRLKSVLLILSSQIPHVCIKYDEGKCTIQVTRVRLLQTIQLSNYFESFNWAWKPCSAQNLRTVG